MAPMIAGIAVFTVVAAAQVWATCHLAGDESAADTPQSAAEAGSVSNGAGGKDAEAPAREPAAADSTTLPRVAADGNAALHQHKQPWGSLEWGTAAVVALHAVALASNSFILAEGRMVAFFNAALSLLLGRSAVSAQLRFHDASAAAVAPAADLAATADSSNTDAQQQQQQPPPPPPSLAAYSSNTAEIVADMPAAGRHFTTIWHMVALTVALLAFNWGLATHGLVSTCRRTRPLSAVIEPAVHS